MSILGRFRRDVWPPERQSASRAASPRPCPKTGARISAECRLPIRHGRGDAHAGFGDAVGELVLHKVSPGFGESPPGFTKIG